MKHEQSMTTGQERQMLEHFRTHTQGEPSAAIDAQILAAARAAVEQQATAERPRSFFARLHAWLFGERSHQRWSLVLAGVACLGIGVSLTWRNFEQSPSMYDAVPVSAPVPAAARQAPKPAPVQLQPSAPEMSSRMMQKESALGAMPSQKRSAPVQSAEQAETVVPVPMAEPLATAADALPTATEAEVLVQLEQLLKLRLDGQAEEAAALLQKIKREHPDLEIEKRLRQLQERE